MVRTGLKLVLVAMVIFTVLVRFEQYEVAQNYTVYAYASCDPTQTQCFAAVCDPSDEECDSTPYVKIEMAAFEAPQCVIDGFCEEITCDGSETCIMSSCSDETLEEGERCIADDAATEPEV